MPFKRPLEALGEEIALRLRRLSRAARQGARRRSTGTSCNAELRAAARPARWSASGLRCSSRRAASARPTACASGRHVRRGRGDHRRLVDRAGVRDGDGAGLRRDARRRLQQMRVIHGQTDRIEYGIGAHASRATVMTGFGDARRRAEGAREGARRGRRAAAGAGRALDIVDGEVVRTRQSGRPVDQPRRNRRGAGQRSKTLRRARSRALGRRLVLRRPPGLPLRHASRGGAGRSGRPAA